MRAQVGILGAGPAGLLLSHLSARAGATGDESGLDAPDGDRVTRRLRLSQLRHPVASRAAATSLAENDTGLPHGGGC